MPTAYAEPVIPAPAVAAAAGATDADAATGGGVTAVYRGSSPSAARAAPAERKKSKTCKFPGCNKSIKSQGHCQKHGAKPKRCRVAGCEKQAQGTHDGMCKRHWKEIHEPEPEPDPKDQNPEPQGASVYDVIIPASIGWKPPKPANSRRSPAGADSATAPAEVMPLIAHLRNNHKLEAGWHRAQERLSRGMKMVASQGSQLEAWERQLVFLEIGLISGLPNPPHKELSHAWGREKGFHNVLVSQICERRGEVERKKRSDQGRLLTNEQRAIFKVKLNRTRSTKRPKPNPPARSSAAPAVAVAAASGAVAVAAHVADAAAAAVSAAASGLSDLAPSGVRDMAAQEGRVSQV